MTHLQNRTQAPPLQLPQASHHGPRSMPSQPAHDETRVVVGLEEEVESGDDGRFVDGIRGVEIASAGVAQIVVVGVGRRADGMKGD